MSHNGKILGTKDGFDIIECEKCGFVHVFPYPSLEDTKTLYSEEYYEKNRKDYIKNLEEDKEWWQLVYKERVEQIEKYLINKEAIKVLDIGTGAGYFLSEAKNKNWIETGIEPSQMASFYAIENDLNIIRGFYNKDISYSIGEFDVIHMNHVLEHMLDPKEILGLIHTNLKKNGLFCVAVPNDFNKLQEIASKLNEDKQWWITPQEHINYFSFKSLKNLLAKNGFEILEETTSFPMELFVLMDENYIGETQKGRVCHFKRKKLEQNLFEFNIDVKQSLYRALAREGLGRDVILIARKSDKSEN